MRSHKVLSPKVFSVLHEAASLTKLFRVAHRIAADGGPTRQDKYLNTPRGRLFSPYTLRFAQSRIRYQISGKAKYAHHASRPPKDICCWTSYLGHDLCATLKAYSVSYNDSPRWKPQCKKSQHISFTPQSRSSYCSNHVSLLSHEFYRQSCAQCAYRGI